MPVLPKPALLHISSTALAGTLGSLSCAGSAMQPLTTHLSWKPLQRQHRGSTATVLLVALMFLASLFWLRQHADTTQAPARPLAERGIAPAWSVPTGLQAKPAAARQGIETGK